MFHALSVTFYRTSINVASLLNYGKENFKMNCECKIYIMIKEKVYKNYSQKIINEIILYEKETPKANHNMKNKRIRKTQTDGA